MKKIGTITFHWATNYGAVLQAFALQKCLLNHGYDTEIIDYTPVSIILKERLIFIREKKISELKKERNLAQFRKNELVLSRKRYYFSSQLKKCSDNYSAIICGSDQIWNKYFTLDAFKKPNLSYFLDFAGANTKRIAYATSFGMDISSEAYRKAIQDELSKFCQISVRENTGLDILHRLNIDAKLICDPTILLKRTDYDRLLKDKTFHKYVVYPYLLHDNQETANAILKIVESICMADAADTNTPISIYEWLYRIKYSEVVITNSYHGMILSLIFNTNFIVVPVEGSNMNDRIYTVLNSLNLRSRLIDKPDYKTIHDILADKIEWKPVNALIDKLRNDGETFLIDCLE